MPYKRLIPYLVYFVPVILGLSCISKVPESGKLFKEKSDLHDHPKKSSEDFKVFLGDFSNDSSFQLSRVVFPFVDCYVDPTGDSLCDKVERIKWKHLSLIKNNEIRAIEYSNCSSCPDLNKITYSIAGIENGTGTYYYFELRDNKWYLFWRLTYE